MPIRLRENIAYCTAGGRAVFMDIDRGRYFALPERPDAFFRGVVAGELALDSDREALDTLTRSGIIDDEFGGENPARPSPLVCRALKELPESASAAPLVLCALAVIAELRAAHWIRKYRFGPLIGRLASIKASDRKLDTKDSLLVGCEIAGAFSKTALIIPTRDRCLVRSIAFFQMALRRQADANLVFGVSVDPFAAHCWVQSGEYVLNDRYERVRTFTPILSI